MIEVAGDPPAHCQECGGDFFYRARDRWWCFSCQSRPFPRRLRPLVGPDGRLRDGTPIHLLHLCEILQGGEA